MVRFYTNFLLLVFLLFSFFVSAKDKKDKLLADKKEKIEHQLFEGLTASSGFFERNNKQYAGDFLYRINSPTACIDFYKNRFVFSMRKMTKAMDMSEPGKLAEFDYIVWEIELKNATTEQIKALHLREEKGVNYFDTKGKHIAKEVADELLYKSVYPYIDLRFYRNKVGQMQYDFILHPGASMSDIQMVYKGVSDMKVDRRGELNYTTKWGNIREKAPYSYLQANAKEVNIKYTLQNNSLGFSGNIEEVKETLVIDPIYVDWSTYFYGDRPSGTFANGLTYVYDLDIDDEDHVYVTGMTYDRFPTRSNAYDTSPNGYYSAFVCKMAAHGDSIVWFSYLGADGTSGWTYAFAIAVNELHEPVVAGFTWNGAGFPITDGAFDQEVGTWYEGFVTKFGEEGDSLVFSSYLGGSNYDKIHGLIIDASGYVYVTGSTESSDFPVTANCFQSQYGGAGTLSYPAFWYGDGDAFLTKINPDGKALDFSTYIGGPERDVAYKVALSSAGDIYLVGKTASGNFPVTLGSSIFNSNVKGSSDGFVMKFKPDGKTLVYSKMMGGSGEDWFESIYVNEFDQAYIAGISRSSDFYTSSDAYQKSKNGGADIVVVKMHKLGQNVIYSTYLGGSGDETSYFSGFFSSNVSISANVRQEAVVCGVTSSNDFPITPDALMVSNPSNTSGGWWQTAAVISKLDYFGKKILYGTYFGGSNYEFPAANKLKRISCFTNILYGGFTVSNDYPTTAGVYKEDKSGGGTGWWYTGFISKFRDTLYTDPITLSLSDTLVECDNVFEILDAQNEGADILWSNGSKDRYQVIEEEGTYWVRATYGCDTVRDTIHFKLEHSPKIPVLPTDTTYCDDFPDISLDAKNDTIISSYLWSNNDTTQTIDIHQEGKYWVRINTPNCGTKTDTVSYTLRYTPDLTLPKDSVFCDEISIDLSSGLSGNDEIYSWSTGDSVNVISVTDTGYYKLIATNICGVDSAEAHLSLLYTPELTLPDDTIFCNAVGLPLSIGKKNNEESYLWLDIDNGTVFSFNDSVYLDETGLYVAQINHHCANIEDSIRLSLLTTPLLDLGPDTVVYCNDVSATLSGGTDNNGETYLWDNNSTVKDRNISNQGLYWLKVTNLCGSVADSVRYIRKVTPVARILGPDMTDARDSIFCDAVNIALHTNLNDPDATYLWSTGATSASITANQAEKYKLIVNSYCGTAADSVNYGLIYSPSLELGAERVFCGAVKSFDLKVGQASNMETYLWSDSKTSATNTIRTDGKHWVQISNKCALVSDTLYVRVSPYPLVDLGPDTTLCGNIDLVLDAGNEGMNYLWEPYGETGRTINAQEQKVYRVTVTNADNCSSWDEFEIRPDCISYHHIPTAFSPNNDGLNDIFKPLLTNYENYTLSIFNRWGELIYTSHDINEGWDGTYQGKEVLQGIYMYKVSFRTTEDLVNRNFQGILTLLR